MKARQLVWIRRISQGFFLVLFFILLAEARLPQDVYVDYSIALTEGQDLRLDYPVSFFFQLDPLVWLSSLISGYVWLKGFLWAVGLLLVTFLLGRVFCSFICPFGTIHHMVGWFRPALKDSQMIRANRKSSSQKVKYFVLVTLLIAALFGLNLSGIVDPISLLFRSIALAVLPGIGGGLRSLFDLMVRSDAEFLNLLSYGGEELLAPVFGYTRAAYQTAWFIGLAFLVILFLNRLSPRFWCRVLCPLGALLGIASRLSILKLERNPQKCTECNLCTKACQGAASPGPEEHWENGECLVCFNCFDVCPESALSFRLRWRPLLNRRPDIGRRAFLSGLLAGVSLPLLGRLDGRLDKMSDPRLIRPPGSIPEGEFLALCQRCGLCMRACPTNAIHPTLTEAGMPGFWTPHLIMSQGYCEYTCTLCGSVCPSGAIKEITVKEKVEEPIKIGSAYLDRGRCLPWSGNAPCIVCEEHCPTSPKAIELREAIVEKPGGKKLRVQLPYVDLETCMGCGICEYKCPVKGRPAIRVIAAGESRSVRNRILLGRPKDWGSK